MKHLGLNLFAHTLSAIVQPNTADPFTEALEALVTALGASSAASWRYNVSDGYFSCHTKINFEAAENSLYKFVHPFNGSLLAEVASQFGNGEKSVIFNSSKKEWQSKICLPKNFIIDGEGSLFCVPFYNLSLSPETNPRKLRGVITIYFSDMVKPEEGLSEFISTIFSQIYSNHFLLKKDEASNKVVEYFTDRVNFDPDRVLEDICASVLKDLFNVEACSIYELNAHKGGFQIASTTGISGVKNSSQVLARIGSGLISAISQARTTVTIPDLNDTAKVSELLNQNFTTAEVMDNMESATHPAKSAMFVPVFNPMAQNYAHVPAVIRLVNKRLDDSDELDFFDEDDAILGVEVAKMIALYEEQARTVRQQLAFSLQFGHEAQAPAVGIRGTADRILYKLQKDETEQIPAMAQDIFDFAEILISFSESLTFGFGDRSLPRSQRYSVRQFNLRTAIESAKKVVIPFCRNEALQFDDIKIVGTFPLIFGDQRALMQVFYNLLTNAIKYRDRENGAPFGIQIAGRTVPGEEIEWQTDDNAIKLALRRWWTFQRRYSKDAYLIEVTDYGVGMTKDDAEKVFLQGFRSPTISTVDIRGSGIGLSIVKNILRDFDSMIWVSRSKNPTRFSILIPGALSSGRYFQRR